MNPRRRFLFVGSVLALAPFRFGIAQQTKKIPVVGYVGVVETPEREEAFLRGMREHGYIEGRNVQIVFRFAGGRGERLPGLVAELLALPVDVLVTVGQALDIAQRMTNTVPIVFPIVADPVEQGHVASLRRPGGNVTGLSSLNPETAGKRLELLRSVAPRLSRVAVLLNPDSPSARSTLKQTQAAAERLGIRLKILEARNPDELQAALAGATKDKAGALYVVPDLLLFSLRKPIIDFAAANRLPTIFTNSLSVDDGGLMSYGSIFTDFYRRAAAYVDKILKGAKPADLPVEQASQFELVINLKTAKALGLTIPQSVLFRADRVIE